MNEKFVKMIVKTTLGIATSALIGYMMKEEKKIQARIDDYYDEKNENEQQS